jgi:putrescine transport system ATP-binding protein
MVALALRPEKIRITLRKPGEAGENCVRGVVSDIAYLGDLSIYNLRLDNGQMFRAARPNITRFTDQPITWDDRVYLSWSVDAAVMLTQ